GEAMAIATGGVVPDGADSVVPIELVEERDGVVVVTGNVTQSDNVRARGGDLHAGDAVVEAGVRLGPAHVGALAAAGVTSVRCANAPRVAVIVTGTELRAPGEVLEPGQIYDANGFILAAQLRSAGALLDRLPPVADDESATRAAIEQGLEADVLVTTGGVSVGVYDLVRAAEAELGVEEIFWRVAMQPGKPVSFGVRGETLVFGLPGNPVSSLVGFELFVRPALLALQGLASPLPRLERGRLAKSVRRNPARDELIRARSRLDPDGIVLEPLELRRAENGEVAGGDDPVLRRAVDERRVRQLDLDRVSGPDRVDVRERREVRRPVSGDVDEAVLAGHERAQVAARALRQRVVVGAVDENHVESDAVDPDPADGRPALHRLAKGRRLPPDRAALRREVRPQRRRPVVGDEVLVRIRELALLPVRVE